MFPWDILEIEETKDASAVRKAYAKKLKVTRPDENPEGYQQLVQARDFALAICEGKFVLHVAPPEPETAVEEPATIPSSPISAPPTPTPTVRVGTNPASALIAQLDLLFAPKGEEIAWRKFDQVRFNEVLDEASSTLSLDAYAVFTSALKDHTFAALPGFVDPGSMHASEDAAYIVNTYLRSLQAKFDLQSWSREPGPLVPPHNIASFENWFAFTRHMEASEKRLAQGRAGYIGNEGKVLADRLDIRRAIHHQVPLALALGGSSKLPWWKYLAFAPILVPAISLGAAGAGWISIAVGLATPVLGYLTLLTMRSAPGYEYALLSAFVICLIIGRLAVPFILPHLSIRGAINRIMKADAAKKFSPARRFAALVPTPSAAQNVLAILIELVTLFFLAFFVLPFMLTGGASRPDVLNTTPKDQKSLSESYASLLKQAADDGDTFATYRLIDNAQQLEAVDPSNDARHAAAKALVELRDKNQISKFDYILLMQGKAEMSEIPVRRRKLLALQSALKSGGVSQQIAAESFLRDVYLWYPIANTPLERASIWADDPTGDIEYRRVAGRLLKTRFVILALEEMQEAATELSALSSLLTHLKLDDQVYTDFLQQDVGNTSYVLQVPHTIFDADYLNRKPFDQQHATRAWRERFTKWHAANPALQKPSTTLTTQPADNTVSYFTAKKHFLRSVERCLRDDNELARDEVLAILLQTFVNSGTGTTLGHTVFWQDVMIALRGSPHCWARIHLPQAEESLTAETATAALKAASDEIDTGTAIYQYGVLLAVTQDNFISSDPLGNYGFRGNSQIYVSCSPFADIVAVNTCALAKRADRYYRKSDILRALSDYDRLSANTSVSSEEISRNIIVLKATLGINSPLTKP